MKNIKEDIKTRQFKRVYLLYGTEEYLKKLYRNKLKEAVLADSDAMNLAEYAGKGIDEKDVQAFADTMPFFADYHLLVLENTGWFKSATDFAEDVDSVKDTQKSIKKGLFDANMQARIDLETHITAIANGNSGTENTNLKNIRNTRRKERGRAHIDFMEGGMKRG